MRPPSTPRRRACAAVVAVGFCVLVADAARADQESRPTQTKRATNCVSTPGFVAPPECRPDEHNTQICRQGGDTAAVGYACEPFVNACPGYVMAGERQGYEGFQGVLPRAEIAGTRFPRTDRLQYRGIRESMDQFTVGKVLRAIGGDPTPSIGGRLYWQAASVLHDPDNLRGKNSLADRLGRAYQWYVLGKPSLLTSLDHIFADHGMLDDVRRLLACRPSYGERDAAYYATDLTRKALRHLEAKWGDGYSRHLFAYNTEEFRSYGDFKGGIQLYSTTYPRMAHAYGSKILAFTNLADRTLDLNYWNFVHGGGVWGYHFADRAEFVTANVIDPRAVRGIWRTDEADRDEMGRNTAMPTRAITYALMRLRHEDVNYGVILDAAGVGCILQVGAHFEGCVDPIPPGWDERPIRDVKEIEFGPLSPDGKPLAVMAVVRACDVNRDPCAIPDAVFAEMPTADRELPASEIAVIRGAVFSRGHRLFEQIVRFAPRPASGLPQGAAHAAR